MEANWDTDAVAEEIKRYLRSKQGESEITMIITFDEWGISGHPNHSAVYRGCLKVQESPEYPVDVMTLTTVNVCRKYLSYADIQNVNPMEFNYFSFNPIDTIKALACHAT
jgi:N-acetylglucosaminylphosphatidylinositol deacetylase